MYISNATNHCHRNFDRVGGVEESDPFLADHKCRNSYYTCINDINMCIVMITNMYIVHIGPTRT